METKTETKPYLSPSQIGMFTRCGEQYRRRYIKKQVIPPGFALLKGGAVHVGSEENFRQKIESHKDLPIKEIADIAAASFDGKLKAEGVLLSEDEEARGKKVVTGEALDSTVRLATEFGKLVAPKYQPIAVEEKVRLELPGAPRDLLGIMDLVIEGSVQDLKTGAKAKSQNELDSDPQFTTYAALYRVKYGKAPEHIFIDNIVDRLSPKTAKVTTEVLSFETTRAAADFDALAARINTVTRGIEAGMFMPASPGSWWCSPKSCGYYRTCPYVNSTRMDGGV